ncbi:hypothetical protein ILUMI_09555 [Ignelater luminosus]|uniref:PH domain-containing protein n=1 Tax=Ignelater luminosus TaxID=2038154 RepID=A0A8K0D402_IGNLU|nr:hypothetical protein ILUMI_09555 [Ignelater luminosus]
MDPFTEKILERARERQRKLLEYNASGGTTSLKETNNTKSLSAPTINDTITLSKESTNTKSHSTPTINDMEATTLEKSDNNIKGHNSTKHLESDNSNIQKNKVLVVSDSNLSNNKNIPDNLPLKEIPGSPQPQLKTLNIQKENFNMEIKLCSTENVRIEVELQEESDSNDEEKENQVYKMKYEAGDAAWNQPAIREHAKKRLQRLGKLYAGGEDADISSPIHRTEPTFSAETDSPKSTTTQKNIDGSEHSKNLLKSHKGLGGLAALAKNINQWEDNLCKMKQPTQVPGINKVVAEKQIDQGNRSPVKGNVKGSILAKAAVFDVASSPNKNVINKDPALLSVSERKALFEKNTGIAPIPKAPISMPTPLQLEKSKSKINVNATPSAEEDETPISKVTPHKTETITSTIAQLVKQQECKDVNSTNTTSKNLVKNTARKPLIKPDAVDSSTYKLTSSQIGGIASKVAALFQNKTTISQQQIENNIREQRQKEMDIVLNRFHKNKKGIVHTKDIDHQSESETEDEETNETTAMISQKPPQIVKKPQGIPPPPPLPGSKRRSSGKRCSIEDSPQVAAVLDDVKRIRVKDTKPGSLYPCLSDIEATTETETERNTASPTPNNSSIEDTNYDSDINAADTSFGREVLETVCKNTSQKRIYNESTASDISDILDEMDDYLDEAIAYKSPDKNGPTPPKQGRAISPEDNRSSHSSSSFQYKSGSPRRQSPQKDKSDTNNFRSPSKVVISRRSSELPAYVVDGDNVLPLTHTISFYRKQQMQGSKTPVRQIIRQPSIEESSESVTSSSSFEEENEVQKKIQNLMEDMTRQQTIISQSSRALNLCYATPEFTGSTEQVEAEKLLLLATHRRAAAQREIERLSVLKTLHPENGLDENVSLERGSLTISNIILPLKREYVRALNATGGKGHHVVCLVKCAEQVHATQLVSTVATSDRNPNLELAIPGTIHLTDIFSNFAVHFEVYCLQAQEEILPHEVKYHINSKKSHNKLTPKKVKGESRLVRPPRESPGGPQAVRSPTFALMGYVVFSIQAINRKNWTLNNTPSMSPLEGIVEMRVKCELAVSVEHHGFLTMFEDVSGFGAWHRRWCLLKGHILSYWKYPEEERKMTPIGSIDLKNCITQQIGSVRRDICARLHTLLIETTRPAESHDKNSLVMECKGDTTIIRHLLSADTKEERIEWCTMFNKALSAIRMNRNSK